jgi:hypothetical protein
MTTTMDTTIGYWSHYSNNTQSGQPVIEAGYRALFSSYNQFGLFVMTAVVLHGFFYFLTVIPSIVFPHIPAMRKYKIQKVHYLPWRVLDLGVFLPSSHILVCYVESCSNII